MMHRDGVHRHVAQRILVPEAPRSAQGRRVEAVLMPPHAAGPVEGVAMGGEARGFFPHRRHPRRQRIGAGAGGVGHLGNRAVFAVPLGAGAAARRSAAHRPAPWVLQMVVPRRVPIRRLVALQDLQSVLLRIRIVLHHLRVVVRGRASVMGTVREGAQSAPLAKRLAARVCFVKVRVVQLLLAAMCHGARHAPGATVVVIQLWRTVGDAAGPLRARPRGVADQRCAPPVPVGVRVNATLPIVRPADGAPLRLEVVGDERLRRVGLLVLAEVRHQQLAPRVREGAIPAARAAVRLIT
mmetsp:Transcript_103834/g.318018  ORF Transcript_103834/g.318018 Transcript_103834/m.318018 type:complete len:296 (-) Transcript_103834:454-1341(-)